MNSILLDLSETWTLNGPNIVPIGSSRHLRVASASGKMPDMWFDWGGSLAAAPFVTESKRFWKSVPNWPPNTASIRASVRLRWI